MALKKVCNFSSSSTFTGYLDVGVFIVVAAEIDITLSVLVSVISLMLTL